MIEILSWSLEFLSVVGCIYIFQQKKLKLDMDVAYINYADSGAEE